MKKYNHYEILDLIDETAAMIAEGHGMNVSYCESMDMVLFPVIVYATMDDDDFADAVEENEIDLDAFLSDLQFLARNDIAIPNELAEVSLDEFRAYFQKNRNYHLRRIVRDCQAYQEEYSGIDEDDE